MELILDMQGFGRFSDKFVVKELAAISIRAHDEYKRGITRILFKAPCSWVVLSSEYKNLNTLLTRLYHGIPWHVGETPYKDAEKIVRKVVENACCIYVKGSERKRWLEQILNNNAKQVVIDLEEMGCPNYRILRYESKVFHWHGDCHGDVPGGYHCAFENVQRLENWFSEDYLTSNKNHAAPYAAGGDDGLKVESSEGNSSTHLGFSTASIDSPHISSNLCRAQYAKKKVLIIIIIISKFFLNYVKIASNSHIDSLNSKLFFLIRYNMDFTKLNNASRLEDSPPTKKMAELEIGKKYDVTGLKIVKTKFGARVLATIDAEFVVFLPPRIAKVLEQNPEQLTQMLDAVEENNLQIHYLGGPFNRCEFCCKT